jgi:hypothetical protein
MKPMTKRDVGLTGPVEHGETIRTFQFFGGGLIDIPHSIAYIYNIAHSIDHRAYNLSVPTLKPHQLRSTRELDQFLWVDR